MKKKILIFSSIILAIFLVLQIDFKTSDDYYKDTNNNNEPVLVDDKKDDQPTKKEDTKKDNNTNIEKPSAPIVDEKKEEDKTPPKTTTDDISVKILIDVNTLLKDDSKLEPQLKQYVPKSGYILPSTAIKVKKGSSAFDVLKAATKKYQIQMEYEGVSTTGYNTIYLKGINHIYEFSAGNESGWLYSVNGIFSNYGIDAFKVKNNDTIRIIYSLNLGCDVGNCR